MYTVHGSFQLRRKAGRRDLEPWRKHRPYGGRGYFLNTAAVGGGLYNDIGSQVYMTQAAAFGLTGFNTASSHAPGVYNNGEFYTEGQRDISNGFYIEDRDAVVFLEGASLPVPFFSWIIPDMFPPTRKGIPLWWEKGPQTIRY